MELKNNRLSLLQLTKKRNRTFREMYEKNIIELNIDHKQPFNFIVCRKWWVTSHYIFLDRHFTAYERKTSICAILLLNKLFQIVRELKICPNVYMNVDHSLCYRNWGENSFFVIQMCIEEQSSEEIDPRVTLEYQFDSRQ